MPKLRHVAGGCTPGANPHLTSRYGRADPVHTADDFAGGKNVHLPPVGFVNFIPCVKGVTPAFENTADMFSFLSKAPSRVSCLPVSMAYLDK